MVRLWTRQDKRSLKTIEKDGVYRVKEDYIMEQFGDIAYHYIELYKWFVRTASERVPKPEGVEFPIWCAISKESMYVPTEETVVYELEIDESEVIYLDGRKWDFVLNHHYIPIDKNDEDKYTKEMERLGLIDSYSFFEGKYANFYPLEKRKIVNSWIRIFDIEDWNVFGVQANIWEIRKDMIKQIIELKN